MRGLLDIYLNDHLAGAIAGRELARRSLGPNRGTPVGDELARFLTEVEEDMATIREVMRRTGARADPVKATLAIAAERVGRLKLNGRLLGYSPLSRVEELEGLVLGVRGKLAMWELLDELQLPELADVPFGRLQERATSQIVRLDGHRQAAAAEAFLE